MNMIKLGDITKIQTGKLNANQATENGEYPFFTCAKEISRIDKFAYDCECVLVAGNGDLNVKYYNGQFNAYQRVYIIESLDKNKFNVKYLYYFLENYIDTLRRKSIGGVIKYIRLKDLTDAEIPNITIENQKKIVKLLEKSEQLVLKRKKQIEALSELKKSIFLDMFGDFHKNPNNLSKVKLGDVAIVRSSRRVFVKELVDDGIPFYRGNEIGLLAENKKIEKLLYITEAHYEELKNKSGVPDIGDLLLPSICPDGRIYRVTSREPFYFKDGRVLWISVQGEKLSSLYLQYALKDRFEKDYDNIASGTTFAELKIFSLKQVEVMLPSIDKQEEFERIIKKVDQQIKVLSNSLQQIHTLYNSLLHKAFNGELFKEKTNA